MLLNCQRVCRKWNQIISDSTLLQQNLFFEPSDSNETPILNPILWEVFGPVLATSIEPHHSFHGTDYEHLEALPWARDGRTLEAPSRLAFAREEASWRNMYISQPPIDRLDWWHTWEVIQELNTSPSSQEDDSASGSGWGHQDLPSTPLTLGILWDLLESRLYRGAETRVYYFPQGMDPEDDEMACVEEKLWAHDPSSQFRGFSLSIPRVKLETYQQWGYRPRANEAFDLAGREWVVEKGVGRRHDFEGDGFNALRHDCHQDRGKVERWSKCEGFTWVEIHGESSGNQ